MSSLVVTDQVAEECVAGCAAACDDGAAMASSRLAAGDFYDRRCWRVIEAAAARTGEDRATRLDRIATAADVWRAWLVELVLARPVYADTAGSYAARVKAAAARRRRVAGLVEALEAETGVRVDKVTAA